MKFKTAISEDYTANTSISKLCSGFVSDIFDNKKADLEELEILYMKITGFPRLIVHSMDMHTIQELLGDPNDNTLEYQKLIKLLLVDNSLTNKSESTILSLELTHKALELLVYTWKNTHECLISDLAKRLVPIASQLAYIPSNTNEHIFTIYSFMTLAGFNPEIDELFHRSLETSYNYFIDKKSLDNENELSYQNTDTQYVNHSIAS